MIALALTALTVAPTLTGAWIWLQCHLDDRRTWAAELDTWHSPPVTEPREELTELPRRVPAVPAEWGPGEEGEQVPTALVERVAEGLRRLGGDSYVGRHRRETAIGSSAQQARIGALKEPTDAFDALVAATWDTGERRLLESATEWWCASCRYGLDRERRHVSCTGCLCECQQRLIGQPGMVVAGQ